MKNPVDTLFAIRRLIVLFIIALLISGITAFWLEAELRFILEYFNFGNFINSWLRRVHAALEQTGQNHKFLIYGYDWLAFGHIIIALFFVEVYKRPVENRWVLKYGMIACFLILPTAFIAGYFRGIPIVWQLIDCSFGVFGFILLYRIYRQIESFRKSIDFTPQNTYNYG
jgi:hypothetical protein